MTEDDAQRMRDAIARDQGWTLCYCSSRRYSFVIPIHMCADCRGWWAENGQRIEAGWRWYVSRVCFGVYAVAGTRYADVAEQNDLGVYLARRFLG